MTAFVKSVQKANQGPKALYQEKEILLSPVTKAPTPRKVQKATWQHKKRYKNRQGLCWVGYAVRRLYASSGQMSIQNDSMAQSGRARV